MTFLCFSHRAEKYNFLGISIVGQSNERGDGGIYIGSIMKGGAVAADGRIEPGDMLLQVRLQIALASFAATQPLPFVFMAFFSPQGQRHQF